MHAALSCSRTTHATILADSMSLLQRWKMEWNPRLAVISWYPPLKTPLDTLPWTCRSQWKWPSKAAITSGLCLKRSEVQRNLRHYLRACAKDVFTQSIAWRRESCGKRKRSTIFFERTRGPSTIRWTLERYVQWVWAWTWSWRPCRPSSSVIVKCLETIHETFFLFVVSESFVQQMCLCFGLLDKLETAFLM